MKTPKLNEKLISKVLKHIKQDFRRYEQNIIGVQKGSLASYEAASDGSVDSFQFPACNTKACFGGWAVLLTTPKNQWAKLFDKDGALKYNALYQTARKQLGLTNDEADDLFDITMNNDPRSNYEEILERLDNIRDSREATEENNEA